METPNIDRIQIDPEIMVGKPVVKDTRIPVSLILSLLAHGYTVDRVVDEYPVLTEGDVRAALYYASQRLERQEAKPLVPAR